MKKIVASFLIISSIISSTNVICSSGEKSHMKHKYGEKILVLKDNSFK